MVVEGHRNGPHPQSMMVSLSVVEVFASHPERDALKSIVEVGVKSVLCSIVVVSVVLFVLGVERSVLAGSYG